MKKVLGIFIVVFAMLLILGCSNNDSFEILGSNLLAVKHEGKWGYINGDNETVIEFDYDEAYAFKDGFAVAKIDSKYTLIDIEGKDVLSNTYDKLYQDLETDLLIYSLEDKWGLIDKDKNVIEEVLYDYIYPFKEGLALVELDSKYGFIDKEGNLSIALEYDDGESFSNGLAVIKKDDKYGYIDVNNNVIIDFIYDMAYSFDSYERAVVYDHEEDVFKLVDLLGNTILEGYDIISGGPLYGLKETDLNYYKIYDYNNNLLVDEEFNAIYQLADYFVRVNDLKRNYLNIWFNDDGSILVSKEIDESSYSLKAWGEGFLDIYEDQFIIKGKELFQVITKDNKYEFVDYEVEQLLEGELFLAKEENKFGIIDKDSNVLLDFLYDELVKITDGYYIYTVDKKMGIMNDEFEVLIESMYDDMRFLSSDHFYK